MIFTQAFPPESGIGRNNKPWTRWDYKTAAEERFCHFEGVDPIPVNTEVALELNPNGTIKSWKAVGGVTTAPEAEDARPVQNDQSRQDAPPSNRDAQIHRQTATKVAANLLPLFPEDEQNLDTLFTVSERLCDYYANGVRDPDAVPF